MAGRMTVTRQGSEKQLARGAAVTPGGVNSARRRSDVALCIDHGQGAYVWDVDGNRLIDYHAAYSAINLGHAFPKVVEAVNRAIASGNLFGVGITEEEARLAEKIVKHVPSAEQVILCNSGSESTFHAIRLARAVTKRWKLLKFQKCYHGFHDYVIAQTEESKTAMGGVLPAAGDAAVVCEYNKVQTVEKALEQNEGQVAAIILEPVLHNSPGATIVPSSEFLAGLRKLADDHGCLLIFDEVITGFRHHIGGYQAVCGVTPDLTTMGKAIANGFPLAAVGGKREYMMRFSSNPSGDVFLAGTYSGNRVGTAAALATIETIENDSVMEHTYRLGEKMRSGLRAIVDRAGIEAVVTGMGGLFVLGFMPGPIVHTSDLERNDVELFLDYRRQLVARGVLELPDMGGSGRNCISFSHTDEDIEQTLDVAEEALKAALDDKARKSQA